MQSGQSLFCLSLWRLAILLTKAGSHLVTTLSVLLRCNLKRRRQNVFLWARHTCLMRKWTEREIIVGVAQSQVRQIQASFLLLVLGRTFFSMTGSLARFVFFFVLWLYYSNKFFYLKQLHIRPQRAHYRGIAYIFPINTHAIQYTDLPVKPATHTHTLSHSLSLLIRTRLCDTSGSCMET